MYSYTLGFLIKKNQILMLNRNKSPWMGSWNGLGGKILENETPRACIQREVLEETGLNLDTDKFIYKGTVTWNVFHAHGQGLYIYIYYLDDDLEFKTPLKVEEGILEFKDIDWLSSFDNEGIAKNIPYFLPTIIKEKTIYQFDCIFHEKILKEVNKKRIDVCQNL
jgi:8-oxo-dGTP diphosphatase